MNTQINTRTVLYRLFGIMALMATGSYLYSTSSTPVNYSWRDHAAASKINSESLADNNRSISTSETELLRLRKILSSKQTLIDQQRQEISRLKIELTRIDKGISDHPEDDLETLMAVDDIDEQAFVENNMALLEQTLYSEQPDPDWSAKAVAQINETLIKKEFIGIELIAVDCAASLCRIETRQESQDATELLMDNFPFLIGWDASAYAEIIDHENGDQSVVYFISRAGHKLPRADY